MKHNRKASTRFLVTVECRGAYCHGAVITQDKRRKRNVVTGRVIVSILRHSDRHEYARSIGAAYVINITRK